MTRVAAVDIGTNSTRLLVADVDAQGDVTELERRSTVKRLGATRCWFNPRTNRYTTIPNHSGDMPEGTLQAILRQAGIDPDQFLERK